jgi:predicted P-loop ATPase
MHKLTEARDRSDLPTGGMDVAGVFQSKDTIAKDQTNWPAFTDGRNTPLVPIKFNELCELLCTDIWKDVFRFNVLTRRMEAVNPPVPLRLSRGLLSDGDIGKIRFWLTTLMLRNTKEKKDKDGNIVSASQSAGFSSDPREVKMAISAIAEQNPHNPIVDYLDSLPSVEGTQHLDQAWVNILRSPDGPIASVLLKKHMVAAVRRVRASHIGKDVDHQAILVLCGEQNAGKTQLVKVLGGPHYVSVVGALRDKDTVLKMQGAMFVDLEEMSTAHRADREVLKAFLSRSADYERQAYERAAEVVPRSYVLWGSSNGLRLDDPTGLRRFWCVTTGNDIDWRLAERLRDVLWAEANTLAATDYDHHLTTDEHRQVTAEMASRQEAEDPLADKLRALLGGVSLIRSSEAYQLAEGEDAKQVMPHQDTMRYGEAFRRLGCIRVNREHQGEQIRMWSIPEAISSKAQSEITTRLLAKDRVAAAIRARG